MALEFTKLSEVENIETPVAEATVIVEDSGSIKRTPMKNISGYKVLGEDGKLLNEVLPDGYPYITTEEKSVECPSMEDNGGQPFILEGFPAFAVGDTVKVKVDGVEYSLVAHELEGEPVALIGDNFEQFMDGAGEYGWVLGGDTEMMVFYGYEPHTVSWELPVAVPMDEKFLPEGIGGGGGGALIVTTDSITITSDATAKQFDGATISNLYYDDAAEVTYATSKRLIDALNTGMPVYLFCDGRRRGEVGAAYATETSDGFRVAVKGIVYPEYYSGSPALLQSWF